MSNNNKPGDRLRARLNDAAKEDDIVEVWKKQAEKEQKIEQLERDYKQSRKKLKETRKQLIKEQFEPSEIQKKVTSKVSGSKKQAEKYTKKTIGFVKTAPKWVKIAPVLLVVIAVAYKGLVSNNDAKILGENTNSSSAAKTPELPKQRADSLAFDILYPPSVDKGVFEVVKVSPEGAAPAYTYLDRLSDGGSVFRVTQQQVPSNFILAEKAEDFQATNVIQVDDNKIYHGYSEKGGIQSLLFIKKELLVTIRSSERFSDDQWAAYYLAIQ